MYVDPKKPGRHLSRTGFGFGATLPHHDPDAVRVQRALMSDHRWAMEAEILERAERRTKVMDAVAFICCLAAIPAAIYGDVVGRILGVM